MAMPMTMPRILRPDNMRGVRDLSPDKGNWKQHGSLWIPGPQANLFSIAISNELLTDYAFSFRPYYTLGPVVPVTPTPDLPVEQREMPVIGYRAWHLVEKFKIGVGRRPKLQSTGMDYSWKRGLNTAKCGDGTKHQAPDQRCGCGLYVLASLNELEDHVEMGKNVIVGAVVGWGRVVQHGTEGWRAQYAKVLAFLDSKYSEGNLERTRRVAEVYKVPVFEKRGLERYVAEWGEPFKEET